MKPHITISLLSLLWCHQESNRGHKDFQSFALPTELWHQGFRLLLRAEATRFELVVRLPVRQFSKLLVSATHPHFQSHSALELRCKDRAFFSILQILHILSLQMPPRSPLWRCPSSPRDGGRSTLEGRGKKGGCSEGGEVLAGDLEGRLRVVVVSLCGQTCPYSII